MHNSKEWTTKCKWGTCKGCQECAAQLLQSSRVTARAAPAAPTEPAAPVEHVEHAAPAEQTELAVPSQLVETATSAALAMPATPPFSVQASLVSSHQPSVGEVSCPKELGAPRAPHLLLFSSCSTASIGLPPESSVGFCNSKTTLTLQFKAHGEHTWESLDPVGDSEADAIDVDGLVSHQPYFFRLIRSKVGSQSAPSDVLGPLSASQHLLGCNKKVAGAQSPSLTSSVAPDASALQPAVKSLHDASAPGPGDLTVAVSFGEVATMHSHWSDPTNMAIICLVLVAVAASLFSCTGDRRSAHYGSIDGAKWRTCNNDVDLFDDAHGSTPSTEEQTRFDGQLLLAPLDEDQENFHEPVLIDDHEEEYQF